MHPTMPPAPSRTSSLYRRVWRWHFYAGMICLPFLALMAITGALYLYHDPIESLLYQRLRQADATPAPTLDAESLVSRATEALPGEAVRYIAPLQPGDAAEVGVAAAEGTIAVYLDPADGRVLGQLADNRRFMEVVKNLHSLALVGRWANVWVEVVAGWAIVLVVSGVFLWWPRGQAGGVYSLRGRPARRLWWRDLHAVTGATAAAAIVFLAVTGMPWSTFWGEQFGQLINRWGVGLPMHLFGPAPPSSPPLAALGAGPWTLSQAALPPSDPPPAVQGAHAGHGAEAGTPSAGPSASAPVPGIGLNQAVNRFTELGLPAGTPVRLPMGPQGAYTAMRFPDDAREQRVVHLDRYTGAVLADVGYTQYGAVGKLVEWGINIHTGRQFGGINRLVMLAACLSIVALTVSAAVMWWKRRPRGQLAAPARHKGDRPVAGALAVAVLLGLLYPLLGLSMLLAWLVDAAVPARWHERWGL